LVSKPPEIPVNVGSLLKGRPSMELAPMIGVGASDLQHALRAEVDRIVRETKGNALAQSKLLIGMLRERNLINDKEVAALNNLAEAGHEAGAGRIAAKAAYFASRDLYNKLLASPGASPVALALASSAVGSYSITQGSGGDTVIFAKSGGDWEGRGAAAGAVIGSLWGPAGAAVGGVIGGLVGHAVDECTGKA
jgi:outer membrane protein with glycine zipper